MDRKLAALLLREVFLPGKYPYHINISSDDYSDNDIEKCMLDMEKEGLLHFWEQKVYLGDSTSTDHCTDFHLRVEDLVDTGIVTNTTALSLIRPILINHFSLKK